MWYHLSFHCNIWHAHLWDKFKGNIKAAIILTYVELQLIRTYLNFHLSWETSIKWMTFHTAEMRLASRRGQRKEMLPKDNRKNLSIIMSQYLWKILSVVGGFFLIVGCFLSFSSCVASLLLTVLLSSLKLELFACLDRWTDPAAFRGWG